MNSTDKSWRTTNMVGFLSQWCMTPASPAFITCVKRRGLYITTWHHHDILIIIQIIEKWSALLIKWIIDWCFYWMLNAGTQPPFRQSRWRPYAILYFQYLREVQHCTSLETCFTDTKLSEYYSTLAIIIIIIVMVINNINNNLLIIT